jgi:hypothetical protein
MEHRPIDAAHAHRVDHDLRLVISKDRDNLEQVSDMIGTEVQNLSVVLVSCHKGVINRVLNIGASDTVLGDRTTDLHVMNIVMRNATDPRAAELVTRRRQGRRLCIRRVDRSSAAVIVDRDG